MDTTTSPTIRDELNHDAVAGRRVHMLMWDAKVSQRSLAPRLGMTQANLSKKIRGERGWSIDELFTVARELRTSVAYIIGETENRRPTMSDGGWPYTPRDSNPEPTDLSSAPHHDAADIIALPSACDPSAAPERDQPADVVDLATARPGSTTTDEVTA